MAAEDVAQLERPGPRPAGVPVPDPAGPVLALRGVRREYGATLAVADLDLDLQPGQVHAVVGENGAGKSTVAHIAAGVVAPTAGALTFAGRPVSFHSARDAEADGVVLIPQELRLYEALTVAENMYVGRARPRSRFGTVSTPAMRAAASQALQRLGASVRPGQRVEELSPASRQMVAIARSLMIDVRVLIMDEPTAALDEWEAQRLLHVIDRLRSDGVAVLYVSHRMHEVSRIADHITVMRDGRKVADGPAAQFQHDDLVRLMVGRQVILMQRQKCRAADEVVLETRGLTRAGEFADVSLNVRAGEVVGMAGIVGSGRSEFAQAVFGYTVPTAGAVAVGGRVFGRRSIRRMIRAGLGYVPEERQTQGLFGTLSVSENVSMSMLGSLRTGGLISGKKEHELVDAALRPLALRGRPQDLVDGLSGGNQQKVLLARWLSVRPKVLILDEPTRGIDIGTRAEIYGLIDELTARGVGVLLISSDLQELLLLCDRIVVMRRGRLVAEFGSEEMSEITVGGAALGIDADAAHGADL
jgi:rhamnose transport system ATP-binding protein